MYVGIGFPVHKKQLSKFCWNWAQIEIIIFSLCLSFSSIFWQQNLWQVLKRERKKGARLDVSDEMKILKQFFKHFKLSRETILQVYNNFNFRANPIKKNFSNKKSKSVLNCIQCRLYYSILRSKLKICSIKELKDRFLLIGATMLNYFYRPKNESTNFDYSSAVFICWCFH